MHASSSGPPRPICRLNDTLVNQIAAGEVIERPAYAVKELVENAIDAGASHIVVSLDEAGRDRIEVRDNGHGIPAAELPLALERHCTSKLTRLEDLLSLRSLGFRGEALASLASVAELSLTTRTQEARAATCARFVEEQLVLSPAAHPIGTTVCAMGLFERVPARRAFMKSASAELMQIDALLRQIAFGTPNVRFELYNNGRRLRLVPAADALDRQRLTALFGARFVESSLPVTGTGDIRIEGRLSAPAALRNRPDIQVLVVNGRAIRDRQLHHAVRTALAQTLPPGLHPAYALSLSLPPETLDVNVHPTKLEVRFAHLREVHDRLYAALVAALAQVLSAGPVGTDRLVIRRPLGGSGTGSGSSGERVARGIGPSSNAHSGAVLVGGRYWVVTALTELLLVDVEQVIALNVEAELERADHGQAPTESSEPARPATRPLLLPETLHAKLSPEQRRTLQRFGFELAVRGGALWLTGIPRWLPPVDGGVLCRQLSEGATTAHEVAAAVAVAWTREITPILDRWMASTPAAVRKLDAATIAQLWSRL